MFKFLLRKTLPNTFSKEDKDIWVELRTDLFKMDFLAYTILSSFIAFILAISITFQFFSDNLLIDISLLIFEIWFLPFCLKHGPTSKHLLLSKLYSSKYLLKGNAVSKEDFNDIKRKNSKLYKQMTLLQCTGHCYMTCFNILKTLKKGEIKFIAIKEIAPEYHKTYYTMHVIYVNNEWCYDTFSQRQWPLTYFMDVSISKIYKSFCYRDIEGKSYQRFMQEQFLSLKKWCEENNCHME